MTTKFKFEKYTMWRRRVRERVVGQMVSIFPAALMDRLGEELKDAHTCLSAKAEGWEAP